LSKHGLASAEKRNNAYAAYKAPVIQHLPAVEKEQPYQNPMTGVSNGSGSRKGRPGVTSLHSGGSLGHKKFVPAQIDGSSSIKGAGFSSKPYNSGAGADASSSVGIYGNNAGNSNQAAKPSAPS